MEGMPAMEAMADTAAQTTGDTPIYRHPVHGAYEGHMLPGCLLTIWGCWWLFSVFRSYLKSSAKRPFRSRGWYKFPWFKKFPLEPVLKVALNFVGINAELWAGHESWRRLYTAEGRFEMGNLQDWQHSAMYGAFLVSGLVDLLAYYGQLPSGVEHAFLGVAFLVEGILLGFHLKGFELEILVHLLLVLSVLAITLCVWMELAYPGNLLLATARPVLVILQGLWFIQIAYILFREYPKWNPDYMGSVMVVPVLFSMYIIMLCFVAVLVLVAMRAFYEKVLKAPVYRPLPKSDEENGAAVLANGLMASGSSHGLANGHHPAIEVAMLGKDKDID